MTLTEIAAKLDALNFAMKVNTGVTGMGFLALTIGMFCLILQNQWNHNAEMTLIQERPHINQTTHVERAKTQDELKDERVRELNERKLGAVK